LTSFYVELCIKGTAGIPIQILYDRTQFFNPSCARQTERIKELYDCGAILKVYQPAKGGFSSMHCKAWIVDDAVIITGTPNTTHNGFENNKEHLLRITEASTVRSYVQDFDATWTSGSLVTYNMMEEAVRKSNVKHPSRRAGRSLSLDR